MPHSGCNGHIFISHSSRDSVTVHRIRDWLIELGLSPWISSKDLNDRHSQSYIASMLKSCELFLLVLSSNSMSSNNVLDEIHAAKHVYRKRIFIYAIDNVEKPEECNLSLSRIQEIRYYEHPGDSLERLARQLLKEYRISDSEAEDIINKASRTFSERNQKQELKHKLDIQEWRDNYWNRKWRNGRIIKELPRLDRDALDDIACELGLTQEEIELASKGKRDRKAFNHSLDSLLKRPEVLKYDLYVVEKRRIQFQVSQKEVRELIARRQSIPIIIESEGRKVPDYPAIEWFEILLRQRRKHLDDIDQTKETSRASGHRRIDKNPRHTDEIGNTCSSASSYSTHKHALTEGEKNRTSNSDTVSNEASDQLLIEHSTLNSKPGNAAEQSPLKHYPEKLLKAISYLASEISRNADNISDLTKSKHALRALSSSLGLTAKEAEDCILLVEASHPSSTVQYLVVNCEFILIKYNDPGMTTVRYPLMAEAPLRRLTISYLNKSEKLAIGYTKRYGTLDDCVTLPCKSEFIGFHKIKLIELLLILLENNNACFSEVSSLPSGFLDKAIIDILNLRFHALLIHANKQHYNVDEEVSRPIQKNTSTPSPYAKSVDQNSNVYQDIINQSTDSIVTIGESLGSSDTDKRDSIASSNFARWPWMSLNQDNANGKVHKLSILQNEQRKYISDISKMCFNSRMPEIFAQLNKVERIKSVTNILRRPILQQLLKAHRLSELKGLKPLLYYNAGNFRVKRGIILFDKGISLLSYFTGPRLFLFKSPIGDIDFKAKSLANSNLEISVEGPIYGFSKVTRATYIFHELKRDSSALIATSLREAIQELSKYQILCSKLKDSIWEEAQELQSLKIPSLGSCISVYDSFVETSRFPNSEISIALKASNRTISSPLDSIFTIKRGGASFSSLIEVGFDGITLLSNDKDAARGRCFPWQSIHSFTYRRQYRNSYSAFVVTSGRGSFALHWGSSSEAEDQWRELAAFIASLVKRFHHLYLPPLYR